MGAPLSADGTSVRTGGCTSAAPLSSSTISAADIAAFACAFMYAWNMTWSSVSVSSSSIIR